MDADVLCVALIEVQSVLHDCQRLLTIGGYPALFAVLPEMRERLQGALALLDGCDRHLQARQIDTWNREAVAGAGDIWRPGVDGEGPTIVWIDDDSEESA